MNSQFCSNCAAWKIQKDGRGDCHRYPPQVVVMPVMGIQGVTPQLIAVYPTMESGNHCFEHIPMETPPNKTMLDG